ncbi:MAG: VOC family protein [Kiloniellales bacterium]|nr:VOC family protein [Kiloniellales bacterium]
MHKSRLGVVVVDCQEGDFERDVAFWGAALGRPARRSDDPSNQNYVELESPPGEVMILLQQVDHASRAHLDIETDDVEAEVARLEKLGAKRIAQVKRWWVMEAPSGHRFCVVRPQTGDFDDKAKVWP